MNTQRWLLPFTCAVNLSAIDAAVRLAERNGATLVALSLLVPRRACAPRVRLEHLQESTDFLEAVRWKAQRLRVAVECDDVWTENVPESIAIRAQNLDCQSVVLVRCGAREALLSSQEVTQVLMKPPVPLLVLTLPQARRPARCGTVLCMLRRGVQQVRAGRQVAARQSDQGR